MAVRLVMKMAMVGSHLRQVQCTDSLLARMSVVRMATQPQMEEKCCCGDERNDGTHRSYEYSPFFVLPGQLYPAGFG